MILPVISLSGKSGLTSSSSRFGLVCPSSFLSLSSPRLIEKVQFNTQKIHIREIEHIKKNYLKINVIIPPDLDTISFQKSFWHKYKLIMLAKNRLIGKQHQSRQIQNEIHSSSNNHQQTYSKV